MSNIYTKSPRASLPICVHVEMDSRGRLTRRCSSAVPLNQPHGWLCGYHAAKVMSRAVPIKLPPTTNHAPLVAL